MKMYKFIFFLFLFQSLYAQKSFACYSFVILKGTGKLPITNTDSYYKMEVADTAASSKQNLHYVNNNALALWTIVENKNPGQNAMHCFRFRIIHYFDTMQIAMFYKTDSCDFVCNDSIPCSYDTLVFLNGNFRFYGRTSYEYWKQQVVTDSLKQNPIRYHLRKFYFDRFGVGTAMTQPIWSNVDASQLRFYTRDIKKDRQKCIVVNDRGIIVAKGKRKDFSMDRGKSKQPYGEWKYYDNNGKFICRRWVYGLNRY
jgi:hypothetical protein